MMKFFKQYGRSIWELVVLVTLALLFRSVAYEPYVVPSRSMLPTLLEGDRILISKFRYGISRYSFPFSPPLFKGRIFEFEQPKRGEVIVFEQDRIYVKRLIGMPGDTVQMMEGNLYINGVAVPLHKSAKPFAYNESVEMPEYIETLPGGVTHPILEMGKYSQFDNTRAFQVPADHYFFMGDNRDDSLDSRNESGIGFVHKDNLLGRVDAILFSSSSVSLLNVPGVITGFRADRTFTKVR